MLVCMCWCVLYVYVCEWTQQTARTHAWDARTHARTHICTHGSLSRSPTPVSCQLPAGERKPTYITPLCLGRYLHARISPLDTLYIYGDSLTPVKLNTNRQTGRAGPSKLSSSSSLSSLSIVVATCNWVPCTRTYLVLATTHVRYIHRYIHRYPKINR